MKTNNSIRYYLKENADKIILENQKAAVGICNSILECNKKSLSKMPILFKYLNINEQFNEHFNIESDLMIQFLELYKKITSFFSPSLKF